MSALINSFQIKPSLHNNNNSMKDELIKGTVIDVRTPEEYKKYANPMEKMNMECSYRLIF